jgi:hypothetical protein
MTNAKEPRTIAVVAGLGTLIQLVVSVACFASGREVAASVFRASDD